MKLNLGCCDAHVPGFVNVDLHPPADQIADLQKEWPWPDDSVKYIRAHDVLEHLPDKIHTMNEAWRVLIHNGKLDLVIPTTDGRGAFQDPTHRSFWTPNDLFYYSNGDPHRERFGDHYGIAARFDVLASQHVEYPGLVWKLHAILVAVK